MTLVRNRLLRSARLLRALGVSLALVFSMTRADAAPLVEGVVWQPDNAHADPRGDWERLGVHELLVQWTAVDGLAFVPDAPGLRPAAEQPDWARIAREPWAREVIVGLAGRFDEAS